MADDYPNNNGGRLHYDSIILNKETSEIMSAGSKRRRLNVTLVRSIVEYVSYICIMWDLHIDLNTLDKIQRRAACFY